MQERKAQKLKKNGKGHKELMKADTELSYSIN
jgi:hypothetical protein